MASRRAARLCGAAGCLLAVALATAATAQEVVRLSAAWDGHVEAGGESEVGITLAVPRDGNLRLTLDGAIPPAIVDLTLRADAATTVWIPYRPGQGGDVAVTMAGGDTVRRAVFELPARERLVALVASHDAPGFATAGGLGDGVRSFSTSSAALPRTPQAYAAVSVVVMDASAVTRLDMQQMTALRDHLAACGRIVLHGFPAEALATIRPIAGCGGVFVASVDDGGAIAQTVVRLLESKLPATSGTPPFAPAHAAAAGLVAFGLLYAVLVVASAILARRWWHLVLPPVAAGLLIYAAWAGRAVEGEITVWSQAAATASTGRFHAHLRADGLGLGEARVAIPADAALLVWPVKAVLHRSLSGDGDATASVTFPTRLHSRDILVVAGTFSGLPGGLAAGETIRFLPTQTMRAFSALPAQGWLTVLPAAPPGS